MGGAGGAGPLTARKRGAICSDTTCPWKPMIGKSHELQEGCPRYNQANLGVEYAFLVKQVTEGRSIGVEDMAYAAAAEINSNPRTYREAMASPQADQWKGATDKEIGSLVERGTWTLVKPPPGVKILRAVWVLTIKRDEHGNIRLFKARLCAGGDGQEQFGKTRGPVPQQPTVRAFLATGNALGWHMEVMDVDSAYLYASLNEEVYMEQPEGYVQYAEDGTKLVCRLHLSLYGLRQAAYNWNEEINGTIMDFGMERGAADQCVYFKDMQEQTAEGSHGLLLWVDDIIAGAKNKATLDKLKEHLKSKYKVKELGLLKYVLGMEVHREMERRTLEITQGAFVDQVLERFGMANCNPADTPAVGTLTRLEEDVYDQEYMALVGSLLYLAIVSRPDIAYAVQALSRHMRAPGEEHWTAAKRVLRYLKGTRNLGIKFGQSDRDDPGLTGYCDADWAGDKDTRRSTTAYIFKLDGGCISWSSRLQPTVALSTAEAEYMAACAAVQEAMYLRQLLSDLGWSMDGPIKIKEDNQGCIALSENPVHHKRTKHIDIKYHFVREKVLSGEIVLEHVATEHQLADLLTKPLERVRVEKLRTHVLGYN